MYDDIIRVIKTVVVYQSEKKVCRSLTSEDVVHAEYDVPGKITAFGENSVHIAADGKTDFKQLFKNN